MMTVSLSNQREKAGPLSKTSSVLLSYLSQCKATETIPLRKKTDMIRSVFYKALEDLRDLGLVDLSHNS